MVWRLHRKGNKERGKLGFIFSYFSCMEAAAPQLSAHSLPIYARITEQRVKLFE